MTKKMYKAGKNWVIATALAVVAAAPLLNMTTASANSTTNKSAWKANSVADVKNSMSSTDGTYIVKSGDTVSAIASARNVSVDQIVTANNLADANMISIGETLNFSASQTANTSSDANVTVTATEYTVAQGDTLSTIAGATGLTVDQLMAFNGLTNADYLSVGQVLELTGNSQTTDDTSATATVDNSTATETPSASAATSVAQVTTPSVVTSTTDTTSSADGTLNALNALRQANGLAPLQWDAGLAARATSRAAQTAASGILADHWHTGGEVIAIGFAAGNTVVNAWFNETNMTTATGSGHHDWEMNSGYTHVGFGYVNGVIVGEAY